MAITKDAQIKFRHGTQSALDGLKSNASKIEVGTFYLTNDTHRLYIGVQEDGANKIVSVNEGITTYTDVTLPKASSANAGQFAYIPTANVLCVSNGQNWVQLNHNTDTLYDYSGLVSQDASTKVVGITTGITPNDDDQVADNFTFNLKGDDGIILSVNGETISVYGTKLGYSVAANKATVNLVDHNGDADSSLIITGGSNVSIAETSDKKGFTISADDTQLDNDLTHSEYGTGNVGFKIFAEDSAGNSSGGTIDPIIKYGASETLAHFNSGTATLDIYTKAEVDAKVRTFDAMQYKGTTDAVPSGDIKNGDTWKASADFTLTQGGVSQSVKVGDLLIAEGAEDASTGFITDVTFGVVPSGNEDTTYILKAIEYGVELEEYTLGAEEGEGVGSLVVKGDTQYNTDNAGAIVVAQNVSGNNQTLVVQHIEEDRNDPIQTELTVNAAVDSDYEVGSTEVYIIDSSKDQNGIETDGYGHITAVHAQKVTIKDTNAKITGLATTTAASANTGTITVAATLTQSDGNTSAKDDAFTLTSTNDNLTVTNATGSKGLEFNLVWGTFE